MKTTKSLHIVFFLSTLCLLIFSGCSKKTDEEIKIGAIFPLTGRFTAMGEPLKFASEIAVEEINNNGGINGKKLVCIYEDSKGEPKEGVTKVQKLINVDNVKIITSFLTGVCEAIKPITESSNALFIAQTVSPRIYENANMTIRFHYSFTEEGKKISEYIIGKKPKKVGLIYSNDPSTSYQIDSIISLQLKSNAIEIVKENFSVGNKEFASIIQKIKANNCDLLYLAGYGNDMPALLNELNTQGLNNGKIQICGNIGFIELPSDLPYDLYKNVVFTVPPFMVTNDNISYKDFVEKYKKKSGKEQVGYAAYYAYDMINILSGILKNSEFNEDITGIRKKFAGTFEGLGGPYNISKMGDVQPKVLLGKYENNKIIETK